MRRYSLLYCITLLGFLLGIHNGYVALWVEDDPEPAKIFPYRAALLPEQDQKLLKKGLHFKTEADLHRRLEDYLS